MGSCKINGEGVTKKAIEFLNTGIFPATVCLIIGMNYKETCRELRKIGAIEWIGGIGNDKDLFDRAKYLAMFRPFNGKHLYYISMRDFDFSDYDMCKIAHEVLHICQFFLPDVLDRNREIEAEAYLHSHLMSQCLKVLRECA